MCEADLSLADQVVIFKGDCACLQAINLTSFTTGDLVFMGGKVLSSMVVSSTNGCQMEHPNEYTLAWIYVLPHHKMLVDFLNYYIWL